MPALAFAVAAIPDPIAGAEFIDLAVHLVRTDVAADAMLEFLTKSLCRNSTTIGRKDLVNGVDVVHQLMHIRVGMGFCHRIPSS